MSHRQEEWHSFYNIILIVKEILSRTDISTVCPKSHVKACLLSNTQRQAAYAPFCIFTQSSLLYVCAKISASTSFHYRPTVKKERSVRVGDTSFFRSCGTPVSYSNRSRVHNWGPNTKLLWLRCFMVGHDLFVPRRLQFFFTKHPTFKAI